MFGRIPDDSLQRLKAKLPTTPDVKRDALPAYLPSWFACLIGDRPFLYLLFCALCFIYILLLWQIMMRKNQHYSFAENTSGCMCVLIDFQWNTNWKKIMTWLILQSKQSGTLIVQGEVGGSAACFAASTSCHLGPSRTVAVNSSCYNRLHVTKDLTCGRHVVNLNGLFCNRRLKCNPVLIEM